MQALKRDEFVIISFLVSCMALSANVELTRCCDCCMQANLAAEKSFCVAPGLSHSFWDADRDAHAESRGAMAITQAMTRQFMRPHNYYVRYNQNNFMIL